MKRVWIIIIVAIVILGIIFIPKLLFNKGNDEVAFTILAEDEIPKAIQDILPKYMEQERALSCIIEGKVYVVVTRGEKRTGGYSVTIDKITKVESEENEEKFDLMVYAEYRDPKTDEIVPQVITYPYVVAKTDLDTLPNAIRLKTEYED